MPHEPSRVPGHYQQVTPRGTWITLAPNHSGSVSIPEPPPEPAQRALHSASQGVPRDPAKIRAMLEQLRARLIDLTQSGERLEQHMIILAQTQMKLEQQAELARQGGRVDLARLALSRKEALQRQQAELAAKLEYGKAAEQKLRATMQRLAALLPPGDPPPSGLRPDAPIGERNSRVIPQDVKIQVAARDGGRCRQCGSMQDLHFDHVIPWSRGGANTMQNIQLLCGPCNRRKGADDIPARV